METYHIHIRGQVQGVGFRPYVMRLAQRMDLQGWVSNTADGVHIEVNGSAGRLARFLDAINAGGPELARITSIDVSRVPFRNFHTFKIVQDDMQAPAALLLSPDFALCGSCRGEMKDPGNRRFGYPFITCTLCGPRYSISHALPYDRERTAMGGFYQCTECLREFYAPSDRRFFSQTNSCPVCGVHLQLRSPSGAILPEREDDILPLAAAALARGEIVAVKGTGGYLLMVDAASAAAVGRLRARKHRPSQPFAVLYPGIEMLEMDTVPGEAEINMLLGHISPIVLLPLRDNPGSGLAAAAIAPGLGHIGAMLPHAPLLEALMRYFPRPVVATSGNVSSVPIVYADDRLAEGLGSVADLVVSHDRDIVVPLDDSVMRYSPVAKRPIWLRRSRGLAPTIILPAARSWQGNQLAVGADLKSAFAILHSGNIHVSQYLGDLEHWQAQVHFRKVLEHFRRLFGARPEKILADAHPGYFSRALALEISLAEGVPLASYQHHEAHFAAILAEHARIADPAPVLGVIFDGTGWGRDGRLWGGEFFTWADCQIRRIAHIGYFPHLAGDKMSKAPRLSALAIANGLDGAADLLSPWFSATEWQVYTRLLENGAPMESSGMGRVFDAVAAFCGFGAGNSYEGESAMRMEAAAGRWLKNNSWKNAKGYICHWQGTKLMLSSLMEQVIADMLAKTEPEAIAVKFHCWVVNAIEYMAGEVRPSGIAFSGGVFQNAVLADLLELRLGNRFNLMFHQQLSPNDENIALGQLVLAQIGGHEL
jgi:hydrogenase maturation protein HypF